MQGDGNSGPAQVGTLAVLQLGAELTARARVQALPRGRSHAIHAPVADRVEVESAAGKLDSRPFALRSLLVVANKAWIDLRMGPVALVGTKGGVGPWRGCRFDPGQGVGRLQ
jgi:hypothetical protein